MRFSLSLIFKLVVMIDIVDSDPEDQLPAKVYNQDSRSKKRLTLPKRLDASGITSSKYSLEDANRQSPTFSPINSVQHKHQRPLDASSDRHKLQERSNVQLNQFSTAPFSQLERPLSRYMFSKEVPPMAKHYEFSPYDQRGVLRKARHSSFYTGKENTSFNYTSSMAFGQPSMMEEKYGRVHSNAGSITGKQESSSETTQLRSKYKHSEKENQQLKMQIESLRVQVKESNAKEREAVRVVDMLVRGFGEEIVDEEGCSNFVKRLQRTEALVKSISDMRSKITGKSETNLKQLWRWLKSIVQDLGSKKDITDWLKQDYLGVPKDAPDETIRTQLTNSFKR